MGENSVDSPVGMALLEQGNVVMKAENDSLIAMAIQRPRDIRALVKSAIDELRAFPEYATKAYYSIPYTDRSGGEEKKVMVEGPSIKAANAMLRHWGNNSTGFRIMSADEERILIQGVFVDHETGMRRTAEISVSRIARKRDGTYYKLAADKLNISIQAGGSKAVRNAALNALPFAFVEGYFAEAKTIAARGGKVYEGPAKSEDVSAALEMVIAAFEKKGVERGEVDAYLDRHTADLGDNEQAVAHLTGVLNAIEAGQVTIEEIFTVPDGEQPIAEPQRTTSKSTPSAQNQPTGGAGGKKLPMAHWRKMTSKLKSTCETCKDDILIDESIFYDSRAKRAHHASHYQ